LVTEFAGREKMRLNWLYATGQTTHKDLAMTNQIRTPGVYVNTATTENALAVAALEDTEARAKAAAPLERLNAGFCPDCSGEIFNLGPCAGLSMNIKCAGCGSKFCFVPPFTPERINNPDSLYDTYPHKLSEL
jgi:hypothetical protein